MVICLVVWMLFKWNCNVFIERDFFVDMIFCDKCVNKLVAASNSAFNDIDRMLKKERNFLTHQREWMYCDLLVYLFKVKWYLTCCILSSFIDSQNAVVVWPVVPRCITNGYHFTLSATKLCYLFGFNIYIFAFDYACIKYGAL